MTPTNAENDLRGSIMPCTHDRAMILVVKRGTTKIDEVDLWTQEHPPELRRPSIQRATTGDVPVVRERLIIVVEE